MLGAEGEEEFYDSLIMPQVECGSAHLAREPCGKFCQFQRCVDVTMQHAKNVGSPVNIHKAVKQDMILGADTPAILQWKREWFIYGP